MVKTVVLAQKAVMVAVLVVVREWQREFHNRSAL